MAYGGWNGAAEGLKTGMALGNQWNETNMKRDALHQDLVKEKLGLYGKRLEADIGTLKSMISEMPDKNDPKQADAIKQYSDQLKQTASIIGTLNPQLGSQYKQLIDVTVTQTKDKATQFTEKMTQQDTEDKMTLDRYAPMPTKAGEAPTVGTPGPAGPEAPPPGPAMEAPNQQVAMEPQAGLTSTATAEPAMPIPDMAPQAAPVGQPPAPMSAPMPQMAQAADPVYDAAMAKRKQLEARMLEQRIPKTQGESKLEDAQIKQVMDLSDAAEKGQGVRAALKQAIQLLDEGIYTGPTAKLALAGASFTGANPEKVKRTQAFQSLMGRQLGPQLKMFGSATAVSNLDLQTVEQYIGKDITQTEESIREILQVGINEVDRAISNYNKKAPKFGLEPMEMPKEADQSGGQQGGFTPDKDGWISLPGGARMRLKPGQ